MVKINEKELKELFIDLKNGNENAFKSLYTKYNKLVYGIAFSILKNKTDSEDVVQIVFTKIYGINKEKLPVNKEASWIYTVTKNEAITFLKKKDDFINLETMYEIEDGNDEINNVIDKYEFNRLICKLNNKEKQIISLKILGNFSFKQISKLLNEPIGTVKWRYYKAANTIKMLLTNLGMFIITCIIGLKTLVNKNKNLNKLEEQITENDTENKTLEQEETTKEDISKSESSELQDEYNKELQSEMIEENNTQKNTVLNETEMNIQENIIEDETENNGQESMSLSETKNIQLNYYGIGFLCVSAIFLIITLVCSIFLVKCQLKCKKKMSK